MSNKVLCYNIKKSYWFPRNEEGYLIVQKEGGWELGNEYDLLNYQNEKKLNCDDCVFIINSQEQYLWEICWKKNNDPKPEWFFKWNCHVCKWGWEFTYTKTEKEFPENMLVSFDWSKEK